MINAIKNQLPQDLTSWTIGGFVVGGVLAIINPTGFLVSNLAKAAISGASVGLWVGTCVRGGEVVEKVAPKIIENVKEFNDFAKNEIRDVVNEVKEEFHNGMEHTKKEVSVALSEVKETVKDVKKKGFHTLSTWTSLGTASACISMGVITKIATHYLCAEEESWTCTSFDVVILMNTIGAVGLGINGIYNAMRV